MVHDKGDKAPTKKLQRARVLSERTAQRTYKAVLILGGFSQGLESVRRREVDFYVPMLAFWHNITVLKAGVCFSERE